MKRPLHFASVAAIALCAALAGGAFLAMPSTLAFASPANQQPKTLTGTVSGSDGAPLSGAVVYLKNTKSLAVKTYIAQNDGGYRFNQLSPNVDYEVYAEFNGVRSGTKTVSSFDSHASVNLNLKVNVHK